MWNYHLCCLAYGRNDAETFAAIKRLKNVSGIVGLWSCIMQLFVVISLNLITFALCSEQESSLAMLKFNGFSGKTQGTKINEKKTLKQRKITGIMSGKVNFYRVKTS